MSIAWWYWSRISPRAADPGRPRDDARIARSAVELVALPHLERGVERHRPAVRIVVVGVRSAELVEHREVLCHVIGNAVHELHLVDGAVRAALAAGAVVGDEHDDRVLPFTRLLEVVEESADVVIGVREEAGIHLRHPREQPLFRRRSGSPTDGSRPSPGTGCRPGRCGSRRADRVESAESCVGRDDAQFLLSSEGLLPHRLVAHVEPARVPVGPLLRCVVRRVGGARGVVEEERLVRRDRLGVADELERLVGDVHR